MLMSTMEARTKNHRFLSEGCMLCKSEIVLDGCVGDIEPMYFGSRMATQREIHDQCTIFEGDGLPQYLD